MSVSEAAFDEAYSAFADYLVELQKLNKTFANVGIATTYVDPFANFAEILVARHFGGEVQKATNKGFDVLSGDGRRVQVKSLKISALRPMDNGVNWFWATRHGRKPGDPLIDADLLALVVFRDWLPYAMLITPIVERDRFPVVNVKDLFVTHIDKLLAGHTNTEELTVLRIPWPQGAGTP